MNVSNLCTWCLLTCSSRGCAVVVQVSAQRLHRQAVALSRLQGLEAHLVLVLRDRSGVQQPAESEQINPVTVHVSHSGRPAHLQTAAVPAVRYVDVLDFTGD